MRHPNPYDAHLREVELRRKICEARVRVECRELHHIKSFGQLDLLHDNLRDELVYTLRIEVFGIEHPEKHVIRFPATWWDAVKERFAPAWFRDKFPVRFTEVTVSLEETYPYFRPAMPHESGVFLVRVRHNDESPVF